MKIVYVRVTDDEKELIISAVMSCGGARIGMTPEAKDLSLNAWAKSVLLEAAKKELAGAAGMEATPLTAIPSEW